jgi:hypothetical protein
MHKSQNDLPLLVAIKAVQGLGAARIEVSYSGGGDSGGVE